jgi:hypothetical protein
MTKFQPPNAQHGAISDRPREHLLLAALIFTSPDAATNRAAMENLRTIVSTKMHSHLADAASGARRAWLRPRSAWVYRPSRYLPARPLLRRRCGGSTRVRESVSGPGAVLWFQDSAIARNSAAPS